MIPGEIVDLAAEYISEQNDGWTKQAAREKLGEIRDYINRILEERGCRDDEHTQMNTQEGEGERRLL